MRLLAWAVVAIVSFITDGVALPIGFALGLPALEVYLAACVGALVGLVVFVYAGDAVRARITGDREPTRVPSASRAGEIAERYGAKGLGLIGPIFPGVTASVIIGLALGLDRGSIARWMAIGIVAMYSLYTLGLRLLIDLIGLT